MAAVPVPEKILNAYNEILDLRQAYTWDRRRVSVSLYSAHCLACSFCMYSTLTIGIVDI
jgi:hypothetical protein